MSLSKITRPLSALLQFLLPFLGVLLVRTALAAPYYVPSGSMEPTLRIGDEMLAMKYAYGYSKASLPLPVAPGEGKRWLGETPDYGDVVVFVPPHHEGEVWVKRVVGRPGDRVQMKEGALWINGEPLAIAPDGTDQVEQTQGSTAKVLRYRETLPNGKNHPILKHFVSAPLDNTAEFEVPAGHLFLMGDNRDHSLDSRAAPEIGGIGMVPIANLIGKSQLILGSLDYRAAQSGQQGWLASLRWPRFFSAVG